MRGESGGRGDGFNAELAEHAEFFSSSWEDLSARSARSALRSSPRSPVPLCARRPQVLLRVATRAQCLQRGDVQAIVAGTSDQESLHFHFLSRANGGIEPRHIEQTKRAGPE